ncbi:DUF885 domain-containing protein [Abyssalbus ytuae]|uniref:DUF885 domain-containing protein n=1 Tax=Abyssalbus ytuae TaxID=2926907 RepID=A0A9E6ZJU2_9FLAO|nr:DUF885 domain-containing protein [Abyssalbus ytuae]UOB16934.1 DUF885 domain-containing protein [Abyssalbus ytuae]
MKKTIVLLVLFALIFQSCKKEGENNKLTEQLPPISEVFKSYYEDGLKLNPLSATFAGDNRYNDILPNYISQEYLSKAKDYYSNYKTTILKYNKDSLSDNDKMSYEVLLWDCNINLEGFKYPTHLIPINQFSSLPQTIGQLAGGSSAQPFKTVKDYNNWLGRLNAFAIICDTAIANMKKGIEKGYVLPKSLTVKVIPQIESFSKGPAENHLFYTPVKNFPEAFTEEEKDSLTKTYTHIISEKIIPAYKKLETFFKEEYLPASRETSGISAFPDGKQFYAHQIKTYTTTTMTADEIHNLGLSEVTRLEAEMEKIKEQVGYKGDLKSFFEYVRNKKELMPFDDPQQVIDNFNAIHAKMKPNLEKLFDLVPKTGFEVRRTEAFREASASAEYNPGSLDGTRPGIFYVPIPDVKSYNIYADEDLFLHEAIPGHHYQISLQQENKDLPDFRKILWYSAYGEGWALYSESLGKELGLYQDPYQYFGMLSAEMHRAIRLVVDTGIHTKGWTREQAIQYSLDHEAEPEASIIAEIERYMSWPGQALSYKVGQLKIIELRNKAEKELGNKFDIKQFHNRILESGCIPLKLLEDKINRWISETKNN